MHDTGRAVRSVEIWGAKFKEEWDQSSSLSWTSVAYHKFRDSIHVPWHTMCQLARYSMIQDAVLKASPGVRGLVYQEDSHSLLRYCYQGPLVQQNLLLKDLHDMWLKCYKVIIIESVHTFWLRCLIYNRKWNWTEELVMTLENHLFLGSMSHSGPWRRDVLKHHLSMGSCRLVLFHVSVTWAWPLMMTVWWIL